MTDFTAQGPITRERAEKAVEWLVSNAVHLGEAKAEREKQEHLLKAVKALAMKASGENSAAAQEREALASEAYRQQIDAVFEATKAHETLLATSKAAMATADLWRSINATLRGAGV